MTNKNATMIYSSSLEEMVVKGFSVTNCFKSKTGNEGFIFGKTKHYLWNDMDCVYYNDDTDEDFYFEVPKNGEKKLSLKYNYERRILVRLD